MGMKGGLLRIGQVDGLLASSLSLSLSYIASSHHRQDMTGISFGSPARKKSEEEERGSRKEENKTGRQKKTKGG